ncbi:MAG: FkbM family methyltransferase [Burkholderiales bacterium]|nr:FkbM family methyltransferase [Anaerolineae bacterium]
MAMLSRKAVMKKLRRWRNWRASLKSRLGLPLSLVELPVLNQRLIVREGMISNEADYDQAWLLACLLRAEVYFDIGANMGQSALLAVFCEHLRHMLLVEPNPEALTLAAEHVIMNGLVANVRFIDAFVSDVVNEPVRLWTVGSGSAGSMYSSHAKTAFRLHQFIETQTTTLDRLCEVHQLVPDFVKIDVEGAEYLVLRGSGSCAAHNKTRFLVEMHSNTQLTMTENAANILAWCAAVGYRAWYLSQTVELTAPEQLHDRGRCHLLLQPQAWTFPDWLRNLQQSGPIEAAMAAYTAEQHASPARH